MTRDMSDAAASLAARPSVLGGAVSSLLQPAERAAWDVLFLPRVQAVQGRIDPAAGVGTRWMPVCDVLRVTRRAARALQQSPVEKVEGAMKLPNPCCPKCFRSTGIEMSASPRRDLVHIYCASCNVTYFVLPHNEEECPECKADRHNHIDGCLADSRWAV